MDKSFPVNSTCFASLGREKYYFTNRTYLSQILSPLPELFAKPLQHCHNTQCPYDRPGDSSDRITCPELGRPAHQSPLKHTPKKGLIPWLLIRTGVFPRIGVNNNKER
jgi:hypothetical protein